HHRAAAGEVRDEGRQDHSRRSGLERRADPVGGAPAAWETSIERMRIQFFARRPLYTPPCRRPGQSARGHARRDPNIWSAQTMRQKVQLFSATLAVLAMTSITAQTADDITPPSGYRNWFHVNTMIVDKASPLFEALGGMHNVHVN